MQIYKKVGMKIKITQVSNYVIMQPCEYATIWVCDNNQLLPHSGSIRKFQLSLKSCNLASWTTTWNDFVPRYDKPLLLWPARLLKFYRLLPFGVWKLSVSGAVGRMTARGLKCVWKIFWRCLEYVWKVSLISCFKVSGKLLKMTRIQVQLGIWGEIHPTTHPPHHLREGVKNINSGGVPRF